jgi:hypothetical protein
MAEEVSKRRVRFSPRGSTTVPITTAPLSPSVHGDPPPNLSAQSWEHITRTLQSVLPGYSPQPQQHPIQPANSNSHPSYAVLSPSVHFSSIDPTQNTTPPTAPIPAIAGPAINAANMYTFPDNRNAVPGYYYPQVVTTPAPPGPQLQYYVPRSDPVNCYAPVSVTRSQ